MEKRGEVLTDEIVAQSPPPGLIVPSMISFSPDNSTVLYLHSEGTSSRQLFGFDVVQRKQILVASPPNEGNTEQNLSLEEKLRRERLRSHIVGVTSYSCAKSCSTTNGIKILLPLQGNIFVLDGVGKQLRQVYNKQSLGVGAIDPQFSPDGNSIAFVADGEIFTVNASTTNSTPIQHTFKERDGVTHGLADYIAQEEMDRFRGYWWSPDSQAIIFSEVDETHIPKYRIIHSGSETIDSGFEEEHRYPFAGKENPRVKLGLINLNPSGDVTNYKPTWFNLPEHTEYITRVGWFPDGSASVQVQNRDQTTLDLLRIDVVTGNYELLIHEETHLWINIHDLLYPLSFEDAMYSEGKEQEKGPIDNSFMFIWGSERTGYMHLYLYRYDSFSKQVHFIKPLTTGDWLVESVVSIDSSRHLVYFIGTYDSPLERHLYVVSFSDDQAQLQPVQLTTEVGTHQIVMDKASQRFVDLFSSLDRPPVFKLYQLSDNPFSKLTELSTIVDNQSDISPQLRQMLPPPQLDSCVSRDGSTQLFLGTFRPDPDIHGPGPYPTIFSVYGGPHVQKVTQAWKVTADMRVQRLRSLGFLVVICDNRGSSGRGLHFEGAIHKNMGNLEIFDQEDVAHYLISQGLADERRIGMYGWSYGGYLTAMTLCKAPSTFHVGISGAPVTNWDGYDTHYTERYMSTPDKNPQGYQTGNVCNYVQNLQGKLLLVHGLIDENVHFRHSARLINALIRANKPYDLLIFPDERHSPRQLQNRIFIEARVSEYFIQHLMLKHNTVTTSNL